MPPTQKQKCSLLPKQHSLTSSTILNQRPEHAKHSARRRKALSSRHGKPRQQQ
ncbi:hypothetical protein DM02DRAFT_661737 [Periconia macrospinosa]|uniref:Uncharacterized protein n=1 Tax=Periconia macrospinosa TaxID=97972 RepID=A0A2V1D939_9PLEO|nr:hypothetical protein DM02DRAFT_661737 [Periconia macrospinosa]